MPAYAGQLHRYYIDPTFNGSNYSGAIVGMLHAFSDSDGTGFTSVREIADRLFASPHTIRNCLLRLKELGHVCRPVWGRWALSAAGVVHVDDLNTRGRFQWFKPEDLTDTVTPKIAALQAAYRRLKSVRLIAKIWGIRRGSMYRILSGIGIRFKQALDRIGDRLFTVSETGALEEGKRKPKRISAVLKLTCVTHDDERQKQRQVGNVKAQASYFRKHGTFEGYTS